MNSDFLTWVMRISMILGDIWALSWILSIPRGYYVPLKKIMSPKKWKSILWMTYGMIFFSIIYFISDFFM